MSVTQDYKNVRFSKDEWVLLLVTLMMREYELREKMARSDDEGRRAEWKKRLESTVALRKRLEAL